MMAFSSSKGTNLEVQCNSLNNQEILALKLGAYPEISQTPKAELITKIVESLCSAGS